MTIFCQLFLEGFFWLPFFAFVDILQARDHFSAGGVAAGAFFLCKKRFQNFGQNFGPFVAEQKNTPAATPPAEKMVSRL